MLNFTTGTCTISREQSTSKYGSGYVEVGNNIEIDIQPDVGQSLGLDFVKDQYKAFIYTEDKDLVKIDDIITDEDGKEYVVKNSLYWKGDSNLESNFELTLVLNLTKGE